MWQRSRKGGVSQSTGVKNGTVGASKMVKVLDKGHGKDLMVEDKKIE